MCIEVTDPTDGLDPFAAVTRRTQFTAHRADQVVDTAIQHRKLALQDETEKVVARDRLPGGSQQGTKQVKLGRSEFYRLFAAPHLPAAGIQEQIVHRDELAAVVAAAGPYPAQDSPHPRDQFSRIERFGQVIVGTPLPARAPGQPSIDGR